MRYYVVRIGSNAVNQSMSNEMVVGSIRTTAALRPARNRARALKAIDAWQKINTEVTVYGNQHLTVRPVSLYTPNEQAVIEELIAGAAELEF